MTPLEIRAGASLAGIFGLRMLGLFLILPVFAVHAPQLAGGGDLTLVGIALGAYGLAQAALQIPFGMASDRWGRKPLIIAGLLIFAAGSFVAASATDIWTVIAGRTLQGAGAISSVVVALLADFTRAQHRSKAMAMVGATIGLSFAVSLVAAPLLYGWIGLAGVFGLTGACSLAAIAVVWLLVPTAPPPVARPPGAPRALQGILHNAQLGRLNLGIFVLHTVQMAMFVVVPLMLVKAGLAVPEHWLLYLPAVLGSFALMVPAILYADRHNQARPVLIGAVALLAAVQLGFAGERFVGGEPGFVLLGLLVTVFFVAFNVLEALLPALVTRIASAHARGAAIGAYNTMQTLGLFCGGLLGGWIAQHHGEAAVFWACAVLSLAWLAVAAFMRPVNAPDHGSFTMEAGETNTHSSGRAPESGTRGATR